MACTFTITYQGSFGDLAAKAKTAVEANGGTFDGDSSSGTFEVPTPLGHISGNYSVDGQQITINITNKPFIITCNMIENYINEHL